MFKAYEVWAVEVLGPDGWKLVQITNFEVNARRMIERKHHKTMSAGFRSVHGAFHHKDDGIIMFYRGGVEIPKYSADNPVYRYRRVTVS